MLATAFCSVWKWLYHWEVGKLRVCFMIITQIMQQSYLAYIITTSTNCVRLDSSYLEYLAITSHLPHRTRCFGHSPCFYSHPPLRLLSVCPESTRPQRYSVLHNLSARPCVILTDELSKQQRIVVQYPTGTIPAILRRSAWKGGMDSESLSGLHC